ncbi:MAG: hypothetical protein JKX79_03020, partial [Labilibaculum sp.]|nr:hypothetical protein [Labilibaculum sp.]
IYVGHSNWGKSYALKQITNGSPYKKTVEINQQWVWVRKMSNDDTAEGLLNFVETIPKLKYQNFILAYCPNQNNDSMAMGILTELQKHCDLYFFVQEEKYSIPNIKITSLEITHLNNIGTVQILKGNNTDIVRAQEFYKFIQLYV